MTQVIRYHHCFWYSRKYFFFCFFFFLQTTIFLFFHLIFMPLCLWFWLMFLLHFPCKLHSTCIGFTAQILHVQYRYIFMYVCMYKYYEGTYFMKIKHISFSFYIYFPDTFLNEDSAQTQCSLTIIIIIVIIKKKACFIETYLHFIKKRK